MFVQINNGYFGNDYGVAMLSIVYPIVSGITMPSLKLKDQQTMLNLQKSFTFKTFSCVS